MPERLKIPQYAADILSGLSAAGHAAYMAGGCVRDLVMGRRPHDYDIATSATPDEVMGLFKKTVPTGIEHGTVMVLSRGHGVEVTTFRSESGYSDARHPDRVRFIHELREDLKRRDFTINSMAYCEKEGVIDPFSGRMDIARRLVRATGCASRRFSEDTLRMFRAFRFSAELGFDIEAETHAAILTMKKNAAALPPERIHAELSRMLISKNPKIFYRCVQAGLVEHLGVSSDAVPAYFKKIRQLPPDPVIRLAAAALTLLPGGGGEPSAAFLERLRAPGAAIRLCRKAGAGLEGVLADRRAIKLFISKQSLEAALCASAAHDILYGGRLYRVFSEIAESGECCTLAELKIRGSDLGAAGAETGRILRALLCHVIDRPEDNDHEKLSELSKTV